MLYANPLLLFLHREENERKLQLKIFSHINYANLLSYVQMFILNMFSSHWKCSYFLTVRCRSAQNRSEFGASAMCPVTFNSKKNISYELNICLRWSNYLELKDVRAYISKLHSWREEWYKLAIYITKVFMVPMTFISGAQRYKLCLYNWFTHSGYIFPAQI